MIIFRGVGARALRCPEFLLSEGFFDAGCDFIRSKAKKLKKSEKQALDSEGEYGVVDEVLVKAQNSSSVSRWLPPSPTGEGFGIHHACRGNHPSSDNVFCGQSGTPVPTGMVNLNVFSCGRRLLLDHVQADDGCLPLQSTIKIKASHAGGGGTP